MSQRQVICNLASSHLECVSCRHAVPHAPREAFYPNKVCTEEGLCHRVYQYGLKSQCTPVDGNTYLPTPKQRLINILQKEREDNKLVSKAFSYDEAVQFIEDNPWLVTENILELLARLNKGMKQVDGPKKILLSGDPAKTRDLCWLFFYLFGNGYVSEAADPVRPAIRISSLQTMTEKSLYAAIMENFWCPWSEEESENSLRWKAIRHLKDCSVKTLFLFNFEEILEAPSKRREILLRAIKGISNTMDVSIVAFTPPGGYRITEDMAPPLFDEVPLSDQFLNLDLNDYQTENASI